MNAPHNPNQNKLLAALPVADFKRISQHLELVPMQLGDSYLKSGDKLQHVYFPTTSIVSLQYITDNGAPAEIACVGNEGVIGIPLYMGSKASPSRVSVLSVGYGYKLKMRFLMEEFNRAGSMRYLLLRYTQALITQTSKTVACNLNHAMEQRLCRWLLLISDRMTSGELIFKKELLARIFGVGIESVMEEISKFQQAGFINYRRDRIIILDRPGLKKHACECYDVVKTEFDRLLGLD